MRRAVATGCALVALAGACSSSQKFANRDATTSTVSRPTVDTKAPSPTTAPPVTAPPGLSTPLLSTLVLNTAPPGYTLQPDSVGDTGPTALAKAARDAFRIDARQSLVQAGFVRGYQRLWRSVDATGTALDQDFIFLYEFDSPEGAQQFAEHWRQTLLETKGKAPLDSFAPAYLPGAVGLKTQDAKVGGSTGVVIATKGVYAIEARVNGGPATDQSGPATQLALAQSQLLP